MWGQEGMIRPHEEKGKRSMGRYRGVGKVVRAYTRV